MSNTVVFGVLLFPAVPYRYSLALLLQYSGSYKNIWEQWVRRKHTKVLRREDVVSCGGILHEAPAWGSDKLPMPCQAPCFSGNGEQLVSPFRPGGFPHNKACGASGLAFSQALI